MAEAWWIISGYIQMTSKTLVSGQVPLFFFFPELCGWHIPCNSKVTSSFISVFSEIYGFVGKFSSYSFEIIWCEQVEVTGALNMIWVSDVTRFFSHMSFAKSATKHYYFIISSLNPWRYLSFKYLVMTLSWLWLFVWHYNLLEIFLCLPYIFKKSIFFSTLASDFRLMSL